jgi:hypothetical protein
MNYYNGFSPEERTMCATWYWRMERWGLWKNPPEICFACGQSEGPIQGHAEDYSLRFGQTVPAETEGRIDLCIRCHMKVHTRLVSPERWDEYREAIREGVRYCPYRFKRQSLPSIGKSRAQRSGPIIESKGPPPSRLWLDEIHSGSLCPSGRVPGNSDSPTKGVLPVVLPERVHRILVYRRRRNVPQELILPGAAIA